MDKKLILGILAGLVIALAFDDVVNKAFIKTGANNIKTIKVEPNKNANSSASSSSINQNVPASSGVTIHSIEPKSININNSKGILSFIANINGKEEQIKLDTSLIDIENGNNNNNYTYQVTQDNNGNYTTTVILPSSITAQIN